VCAAAPAVAPAQLAKAVEAMGAGEIMLNAIDMDGTGQVRACVRACVRCAPHARAHARVLPLLVLLALLLCQVRHHKTHTHHTHTHAHTRTHAHRLFTRAHGNAPQQGFDLPLIEAVSSAVSIPVIASSGAGAPSHFTEVFRGTKASAALAAGIFHRQEVAISEVKHHMAENALPTRV
jgi:imidazole glycerol phosphate synthase subunit HisF